MEQIRQNIAGAMLKLSQIQVLVFAQNQQTNSIMDKSYKKLLKTPLNCAALY